MARGHLFFWICSQENSARKRDKRGEELSTRAPYFLIHGSNKEKSKIKKWNTELISQKNFFVGGGSVK